MNEIGGRLRLARARAQMSLRDLAALVGVSPMAISKYENNQMMPAPDVLARLADVLDVRMEFLLRQTPDLSMKPAFRKHSRLGKKAEFAVMSQVQDWLERYLQVESFIPEIGKFSNPDGFPYRISSVEDAENAAELLRRSWQVGGDAIENLTELLEDKGIKVGLVEGDDDFDALTFLHSDDMPVIAVNETRPADRLRFNMAHELGHLMMHVPEGIDEEKAAHRFAGAFLLPADAVKNELGSSRSTLDFMELLMLKQKYGVSVGAWTYRAKDLGIISPAACDALWKQRNGMGWHKQEPGLLPAERPTRMQRLVRRLVAEDIISESRAAELLGERIMLTLNPIEEAVALDC